MISVNYMDVNKSIFDEFKKFQITRQHFTARDFIEQQLGKDREELVSLIETFCTRQPHIQDINAVSQELINLLTVVKILDNHHEDEITTLRLKFIDMDIDLSWGDKD